MNFRERNATFFEKWLLKKFRYAKEAEWNGIYHLINFAYVVESTISFEESRRANEHKKTCDKLDGKLRCECGFSIYTVNEKKAEKKLTNKIKQIELSLRCCSMMEVNHKKDSDNSCCKQPVPWGSWTTLTNSHLIFAGNAYDEEENHELSSE